MNHSLFEVKNIYEKYPDIFNLPSYNFEEYKKIEEKASIFTQNKMYWVLHNPNINYIINRIQNGRHARIETISFYDDAYGDIIPNDLCYSRVQIMDFSITGYKLIPNVFIRGEVMPIYFNSIFETFYELVAYYNNCKNERQHQRLNNIQMQKEIEQILISLKEKNY